MIPEPQNLSDGIWVIEYHYGITPRRSLWDHSQRQVSGSDHKTSLWDHSHRSFLGSLPQQFSGITPGAVFRDHSQSNFLGPLLEQFSRTLPEHFPVITPRAIFWDHSQISYNLIVNHMDVYTIQSSMKCAVQMLV